VGRTFIGRQYLLFFELGLGEVRSAQLEYIWEKTVAEICLSPQGESGGDKECSFSGLSHRSQNRPSSVFISFSFGYKITPCSSIVCFGFVS